MRGIVEAIQSLISTTLLEHSHSTLNAKRPHITDLDFGECVRICCATDDNRRVCSCALRNPVKPPSSAVEGLSEPLPLLQPANLYEGSGIRCSSHCRATKITARAASLFTHLGIPPCVQTVGSGATEESESHSRKKHMLRLHIVSS
jgi:hypothetical protein